MIKNNTIIIFMRDININARAAIYKIPKSILILRFSKSISIAIYQWFQKIM